MKKVFILLGLCLTTNMISAQVGINKEAPDATLDINPNPNDPTVKPVGVLMPRLTAAQVKTMTETPNVVGATQNGLTVYITKAFDNPGTDKVGKYEYIDSPGYYYYKHDEATSDNSRWVKLLNNTEGAIYTAGAGIDISSSNVVSRTGLEEVTEAGKTGWRYIGMDESLYASTGKWATDLQYIPPASEENDEIILRNDQGVEENKTYLDIKNSILTSFSNNFDFSAVGASGDFSIASGLYNIADNFGSIAIGAGNVSNGMNSLAIGYLSEAKKASSYAIGDRAKAHGKNAVSIGKSARATGDSSLAIGYSTQAKEDSSVAIGYAASAWEDSSVALGNTAKALEKSSVAIGTSITAYSEKEIAMGTATTRDINPGSGSGNWFTNRNKRLFIIGNGGGRITSDAFTILRNAKVGIDIDNFEETNSDAKLQVNGKTLIGNFGDNNEGSVGADNGTDTNIIHQAGDARAQLDVRGDVAVELMEASTNNADKLVVRDATTGVLKTVERSAIQGSSDNIYTTNGTIPAGTTRTVTFSDDNSNITLKRGTANNNPLLIANGSIKATAFNLNSDARLKTNVTDLSSDKIDNLRAVSYVWNAEGKKFGGDNKLQYGFIAQEVEKVYPNLVSTDKDGYKSVNYTQVIPVLTKALQEERAETKQLKETLESQNKRIEELEKAVQALLKK